jgi:hypothetical protein
MDDKKLEMLVKIFRLLNELQNIRQKKKEAEASNFTESANDSLSKSGTLHI